MHFYQNEVVMYSNKNDTITIIVVFVESVQCRFVVVCVFILKLTFTFENHVTDLHSYSQNYKSFPDQEQL